MKKKLLALALLLAMMTAFVPWQRVEWPVAYAAGESDFTIQDGVLIKYNGSGGDVTIPDGVTGIGYGAFADCKSVTSVTIPASVTGYVSTDDFEGCTNLKSIIVDPENTEYSSEDGVLYDKNKTKLVICPAVKETVTVPASVTYIYNDAFDGCTNLKSIVIDPGNTEYSSEDGVVYDKDKTTLMICPLAKETVTIPASVTSVEYDAFDGCMKLKSISVDPQNTKFSSEGSILYNKAKTFIEKCPFGIENVTLANSVEYIGQNEFYRDTVLKSITLPNSVTSIGYNAFTFCSSLAKITIPDSVTFIGGSAFEDCTSLKSVSIPSSVTEIGGDAFRNCSSLREITIPNSVISIGGDAFFGCDYLETVYFTGTQQQWDELNEDIGIGSDVTVIVDSNAVDSDFVISEGRFIRYKGSEQSVTVPDSVTAINNYAFSGCTTLSSVAIPESVQTIGDWVFEECENLTSVTIPSSVTKIGSFAFSGGNGIKSITVASGNKNYSSQDGIFYNKDKTVVIFCPTKKQGAVTLPNTVTTIDGEAFDGCDLLTGVNMPSSVVTIGDWAFAGCEGLTSLTIPDSCTTLGDGAFSGCSKLKSVTIPGSVKTVRIGSPDYCFGDCDALKDVYYGGTKKQWNDIENVDFLGLGSSVTIHFASTAITRQPADASGAVGDKVSFSVEAEGDDLSYQWYYKKAGDGNFTRWANHNAASAALQVYASWHNAQFYCTVFDSQGNALTSDTAKLTVLPKITEQPKDASGTVGDTATFSVKATGSGLTYQWYVKKAGENAFTAWNKKTAASVSTPIYASWNGTQFYCVVTDANGGTQQSDTVMLTVLPKITEQPKNASGAVNDTATFAVKATGAGLSYQWYYKKANESSFSVWNKKTTASVSTPIYKSWDGTQFYCVVKDANGATVQSNTVKLTVSAAAEGPEIHSQPVNANGKVGNTVSFVVQTWDREATFQWYYRKAGENNFTLWKGQTKPTAVTTVYASWNQAEFYCILTGANGGTRKTDTVKLTVVPVFTEQPKNVSGAVNANATFTVKATGAGLSYQWYIKKANESSFTTWNKKTSPSVSTPIYASWNNAQIYCVITDVSGKTVKSNAAMLTVLPQITAQPQNVSGAVNTTASFTVKATGNGLTYQWYYKKAGQSDWTKWNNRTAATASTPIYKSWNGAQFYCEVRNVYGNAVNSDAATLTVQ